MRVADGGLFAGVVDLYVCRECRAVVDVLTWRSGHRGQTPGSVAPACPRCGSVEIVEWREGDDQPGPCPRCGRAMTVESVGIAD
jgi:predicted RNA-binding Zn-ribbon protein involved in translation (DUF1610 family)